MLKFDDPRGAGRDAIKRSVSPEIWNKNVLFTQELMEQIAKHRLQSHPLLGFLGTTTLNPEITKVLHLEFGHAFAQIFTDSLVRAMTSAEQLEERLGPIGKVSSRFLLELNLLDELGFQAKKTDTEEYAGNPLAAHYLQFYATLAELNVTPKMARDYVASEGAKKARATFVDTYGDHVLLTGVLAAAETLFSKFAGPWAVSVGKSTKIDVSKGYHAIHVEDDHGEFIDDDHAEDSWYLFRQSLTPERYDEVRKRVGEWLDTWAAFADTLVAISVKMSKG